MVQTNNVAKRQKVEECTSCMELVLFNSDSLFKIASYLPADGLLNLLSVDDLVLVMVIVYHLLRRPLVGSFKILQQRNKRMRCHVMMETIGYRSIIICNH